MVKRREMEKNCESFKMYKDTIDRLDEVDRENNTSTTKRAKIGISDPFQDIEDRSVARVKEIMKRKKPSAICSDNPSPAVMANYILIDMKVAQLKAQMKARGLKTAGTKDQGWPLCIYDGEATAANWAWTAAQCGKIGSVPHAAKWRKPGQTSKGPFQSASWQS